MIEILAIGNEILSGRTINSNAAFISKEILKMGLKVDRHTVLPDEEAELRKGFEEAINRSQLVICTGGLGPTCDDITRKTVVDLFGSSLVYREEIAAELIQRFGKEWPTIKDQATVPEKAILLKNNFGTAYGYIFKNKQTTAILLPGVPVEMKAMLLEQVIPYIMANWKEKQRVFRKDFYLFQLLETSVDPILRELKKEYPKVDFGIYPALGLLSLSLTASAENEKSAEVQLGPIVEKLKRHFSSYFFESPSGKIEESVHQLLVQKGKTLSIAESCTGGAIAARLTRLPGASHYFLGSLVVYSNALKTHLLGVSENLLKQEGAVSPRVAEKMLFSLFSLTKSDYAIAVTGIAGPSGGTKEKPVGTVWVAVGYRGEKPLVWNLEAKGNREMIIEYTVNVVLGALLNMIREKG